MKELIVFSLFIMVFCYGFIQLIKNLFIKLCKIRKEIKYEKKEVKPNVSNQDGDCT